MGALQKIRNKGGLLVGVLGVALLFFIMGELFNSGGTLFNKYKDKAFVVDGDVVSTNEYQNRVAEFEEFQKLLNPQTNITEDIRVQIGEFVYEQMVKEKLLDQQAEKLGITVTKEEMNDMVSGDNISPVLLQSPVFADPQTRQFNREALIGFLTQIKADESTIPDESKALYYRYKQLWMVIENMMKYYRLEEKYNTLLASANIVTDIEAKNQFEASKSSAQIAYVLNRYSTIPDSSVTVSDKEIENLYNERKHSFKALTEFRKISYISKDIVPSDEDYKAVEAEMDSIYARMLTTANPAIIISEYPEIPYHDMFLSASMLGFEEKEFAQNASVGDVTAPKKEDNVYYLHKLVDKINVPDSAKLRLIVVPKNIGEDIANTRADSIINVLKGGKDFSTVANELNPQSNGGRLGDWLVEPMLAEFGNDFIRKSFGASKGEVLRIDHPSMIQIVNVEDLTRPVAKYKIATVQITTQVSDKTLYAIDDELNKFYNENADPKNFDKAAKESGYNVLTDIPLTPTTIGLPQIEGSRQVVYWAFNEKVGSIKKFDFTKQRVIAVINQESHSEYVPLNEVSELLKGELIRDKKAEKMIADMKAKNQTSLDGYAQSLSLKVDTTSFVSFSTPSINMIGREPVFNIYSQYGEVNKTNGPVKGNTGVYVLSVLERTENPATYDAQVTKNMLTQSNMYRFNSAMIVQVLKDKLKVEDNRINLFYRADE